MNPEKKELYTAKRSSGVNLDDPRIQETWSLVRSDSSPVNWLILGFSGPSTITVKSFGDNGAEELLGNFSDDEIMFGAIRVNVGGSIKFFHVFFLGQNVGGVKRGKASMYESGVFQALEGAHGKISCINGKDGLDKEFLVSQIRSSLCLEESTVLSL